MFVIFSSPAVHIRGCELSNMANKVEPEWLAAMM